MPCLHLPSVHGLFAVSSTCLAVRVDTLPGMHMRDAAAALARFELKVSVHILPGLSAYLLLSMEVPVQAHSSSGS